MPKEISVNSVEFVQAASNSQTAIDNLNASLDEWSNQGEKSIAMEAFSQQFVALEKVIQLYQKLLNQDMEAIKKIGVKFFLSDLKLAKLWRSK